MAILPIINLLPAIDYRTEQPVTMILLVTFYVLHLNYLDSKCLEDMDGHALTYNGAITIFALS